MDIQSVANEAMMNTFSNLVDEGYCPTLECENGSLVLWTEDASCETVLIMNRKRTGFGEHVFSTQVCQGEGESYLAEMVADEIAEIIKRCDR